MGDGVRELAAVIAHAGDGQTAELSPPDYVAQPQNPQYGPEYEKILNTKRETTNVPPDCWGALVFIIVSDFPDLFSRRINLEGLCRVATAVVGFLVNLYIQMYLLYYIFSLLVLPAMLSAQNLYKNFHDIAFANGKIDLTSFNSLGREDQQEICAFALSTGIFLRIILFLWLTECTGEMRSNIGFISDIISIPRLPDGHDTSLMVRDEEKTIHFVEYTIVCMDLGTKVWLMILVYIPKTVIGACLALLGSVWLMAASSIGDLILNSLALAFVVGVDELFASVFFPECFMANITGCGFGAPKADPLTNEGEKNTKAIGMEYLKSCITLLVILVVVECAIYFQPVVPKYMGDVEIVCKEFLKNQVPWCIEGHGDWRNCFPIS